MAISTISITQGAGTNIAVDTSAGGDMQVIKLAESTLGSTALVPASAATGLLVNVGTPAVSQSGAWNIASVASITDPVTVAGAVSITGTAAVTQSGAWTVTSITNAVTVAGTVAISGTPAVSQSGAWNIASVTSITNPVTVAGTVAISGTVPVSGSVTGNQGAAAAVGAAWPIKLTDSVNTAALQSVGGIFALPVKVLAQTGGGFSQVDKTAFTEAVTPVEVIGGVYNDAFVGSPAAGQASVLRITAQRAAHVNLRNAAGAEIGTAANPVCVTPTPNANTNWRQHIAYTASTAATALHTPAAGKTSFIKGLTITPTAAGPVTIFDNTDGATAELFNGAPPVGSWSIVFNPPEALNAPDNVLKYLTGAGAAGDLNVWGFDV